MIDVSDYEKRRAENIKKNEDFLRQLGIEQVKADAKSEIDLLSKNRMIEKGSKRKRKLLISEQDDGIPRRTSSRIRGEKAGIVKAEGNESMPRHRPRPLMDRDIGEFADPDDVHRKPISAEVADSMRCSFSLEVCVETTAIATRIVVGTETHIGSEINGYFSHCASHPHDEQPCIGQSHQEHL